MVSLPRAAQPSARSTSQAALDSVKLLIVEQKYQAARDILNRLLRQSPDNIHVQHQRLIARHTEILEYESYAFEGKRLVSLADSVIRVLEHQLPHLRGRDSLDCLFYLANSHGGKGVMEAKTGNWFGAAKTALRSRELLESTVALDSNYLAAYLGLGVFDYYLSQGLKWLPMFNRTEEGIAAIERATRARFPYNIAAQNVLCWIYMEQDRWKDSDSICTKVLARFPNNSVFVKIATCNALWTQRWDDAIRHGTKLVEVARRRTPVNWCDLFTAYRGIVDARIGQGKIKTALQIADKALAMKVPPKYLRISYVEEHLKHLRKVRDKYAASR